MIANGIFWFGGLVGVALFCVSLFMLTGKAKMAGFRLLLVSLALTALLIPAFQIFHNGSNYLYIGLVGLALALIGVLLMGKKRVGGPLFGIGALISLFLLPALNVASPWETTPAKLIAGNPEVIPSETTITEYPSSSELTPPTSDTPDGMTSDNSTTDLTLQQPDASLDSPDTTLGGEAVPNGELSATEPSSNLDMSSETMPDQTAPSPTQPAPQMETTVPVTTVADELCPCVLKIVTGEKNAVIRISSPTTIKALAGSEATFTDLPIGNYEVLVEAPGFQSFKQLIHLGNNRSLTVNLTAQ